MQQEVAWVVTLAPATKLKRSHNWWELNEVPSVLNAAFGGGGN